MAAAVIDTRPGLRLLVEGGPCHSSPGLRRRRLLAVVLAATLVVVVAVGVHLAQRPPAGVAGGGSLPASGDPSPAPAGAASVTVAPGDTLWAIARRLQPTGDVRPLVDDLAAVNGGAALEVGQRLVLPG